MGESERRAEVVEMARELVIVSLEGVSIGDNVSQTYTLAAMGRMARVVGRRCERMRVLLSAGRIALAKEDMIDLDWKLDKS